MRLVHWRSYNSHSRWEHARFWTRWKRLTWHSHWNWNTTTVKRGRKQTDPDRTSFPFLHPTLLHAAIVMCNYIYKKPSGNIEAFGMLKLELRTWMSLRLHLMNARLHAPWLSQTRLIFHPTLCERCDPNTIRMSILHVTQLLNNTARYPDEHDHGQNLLQCAYRRPQLIEHVLIFLY